MGSYRDVLNNQSAWFPAMPRPDGWGELLVSVWQARIDEIIGTTSGRPRLWLRWAPEVMRWRPARPGEGAYDFPEWCAFFLDGKPVEVPRWVLMQRCEPEQFAPDWEAHRKQRIYGEWYDIRGPLPKERYTKVWSQQVHEDGCCLRAREAKEPCWGYYLEPNDEMLEWVQEQWRGILADPDVKPFADARQLTSPRAQLAVKSKVEQARAHSKEIANEVFEDLVDHEARRPHTVGEAHVAA